MERPPRKWQYRRPPRNYRRARCFFFLSTAGKPGLSKPSCLSERRVVSMGSFRQAGPGMQGRNVLSLSPDRAARPGYAGHGGDNTMTETRIARATPAAKTPGPAAFRRRWSAMARWKCGGTRRKAATRIFPAMPPPGSCFTARWAAKRPDPDTPDGPETLGPEGSARRRPRR